MLQYKFNQNWHSAWILQTRIRVRTYQLLENGGVAADGGYSSLTVETVHRVGGRDKTKDEGDI